MTVYSYTTVSDNCVLTTLYKSREEVIRRACESIIGDEDDPLDSSRIQDSEKILKKLSSYLKDDSLYFCNYNIKNTDWPELNCAVEIVRHDYL